MSTIKIAKFVSALIIIATCLSAAWPQDAKGAAVPTQFVFLNDNQFGAQGGFNNQLEGFSVASDGTLTPLPGSPFSTGGLGAFGNEETLPRLAWRKQGNFLYVANDGSSDISIFKIDPVSGNPLQLGAPVRTFGTAGGSGMGIVVSPDGKFLFVGNGGSQDISSFSIGPSGGLKFLAIITTTNGGLQLGPSGIHVTPDGKFLIVAFAQAQIGAFAIDAQGGLKLAPGSPLPFGLTGGGMDIDCAGKYISVGLLTQGHSWLARLTIDASGVLTDVTGPFPHRNQGSGTAGVLQSLDGNYIYIANTYTETITTYRVKPDGSLNGVVGDPFDTNTEDASYGLSFDQTGKLLFVAAPQTGITVLQVLPQGVVASVPGSPFHALGLGILARSVQGVPTQTCSN